MEYIIEFRSGSFFLNLDSERGGMRDQAKRFASKTEAVQFMCEHEWILFAGGAAVPLEKSEEQKRVESLLKDRPSAETPWDERW